MTSYHGDVSFDHFLISHLKLIKRSTRKSMVTMMMMVMVMMMMVSHGKKGGDG